MSDNSFIVIPIKTFLMQISKSVHLFLIFEERDRVVKEIQPHFPRILADRAVAVVIVVLELGIILLHALLSFWKMQIGFSFDNSYNYKQDCTKLLTICQDAVILRLENK